MPRTRRASRAACRRTDRGMPRTRRRSRRWRTTCCRRRHLRWSRTRAEGASRTPRPWRRARVRVWPFLAEEDQQLCQEPSQQSNYHMLVKERHEPREEPQTCFEASSSEATKSRVSGQGPEEVDDCGWRANKSVVYCGCIAARKAVEHDEDIRQQKDGEPSGHSAWYEAESLCVLSVTVQIFTALSLTSSGLRHESTTHAQRRTARPKYGGRPILPVNALCAAKMGVETVSKVSVCCLSRFALLVNDLRGLSLV